MFDLKKIFLSLKTNQNCIFLSAWKETLRVKTTDNFNMDKQIITIDDSEDEVALKAGQQPLQESG